MRYNELFMKVHQNNTHRIPMRLACFDPGETTGFCIFENGELDPTSVKQLNTKDIPTATKELYALLQHVDFVVYENYKVYDWKSDDHKWNELHTSQLIGTIRTLCALLNIPTHTQMAGAAKPFCTDQKLKDWGYYYPALKHARDAIRHGAYFLLFNLHHFKPK